MISIILAVLMITGFTLSIISAIVNKIFGEKLDAIYNLCFAILFMLSILNNILISNIN